MDKQPSPRLRTALEFLLYAVLAAVMLWLTWLSWPLRYFFPLAFLCIFALAVFGFATRQHSSFLPPLFHVALEAVSLALLAVLFSMPLLVSAVTLYDEGLILTAAWRVSQGALPYRDFFTMYGPGQTALLGTIFALCGKSLLLARLVDMAFRVAASLVVWSIVRPFARPLPRLLCHISFVLWLHAVFSSFGCSPLVPFLFFGLLSIRLVLAAPSDAHPLRPCVFSGMAMGAAMLFRHDLAALAAMAVTVLLCVPAMQPSRRPPIWGAPLAFALATLVLPLLVYGSLALVIPFQDLWEQLVVIPLFVFPSYRALPYPSFRLFLSQPFELSPCFLLPLLLIVIPALVALRTRYRRSSSRCARPVFFLAVFAVALFPYALGRSDFNHVLLFALPAIPLLFLAASIFHRSLLPSALLAAWAIAWGHDSAGETALRWKRCETQRQTIRSLREVLDRCPPGPVFVGEASHDRLVLNDVALYFLLDRPPATKFFAFEPGIVTTPAVQDVMIRELQDAHVQTIILCDRPPHIEPNRSAEDSRARRLDSFLRKNYVPLAQVPPYLVCVSPPATPPSLSHSIPSDSSLP